MWRYFFLLFLLPIWIASDDNSVQVNGTIGPNGTGGSEPGFRFVFLSENTISCEATSVTNTGSTIYLLGSIEVNLNDNTSTGGDVYMSNIEYDPVNEIFRALGRDCNLDQVKIAVYTDNDTTGAAITPEEAVLIYQSGTAGTGTENHKIVFGFYAQDDSNNTLATTVFDAHFQFYWTD